MDETAATTTTTTAGRRAPPPRWPAWGITAVVGPFVVVVAVAWTWSHAVRGEPVDDVAWIILGATALRVLTLAVAWAGVRDPAGIDPRLVSLALFGCAAAQLVYPVAELAIKALVLVGLVDDGPSGVRNMSATGWFNAAAAATVFGLPGALFAVEGAHHRRRHHLARRWVAAGACAGVAALLVIGLAVG